MTLRQKRALFILVWAFLILSGPFTIFKVTSFSQVSQDPLLLINFFQRITGLLAFTLLFIQIIIGSFMGRWVQIIGAKAYKYHITEGLVTYGFILIHPFMQVLLSFNVSGIKGALVAFVPFFYTRTEMFLSYGKIAFVLLTIGVVAAYFRTKPFFRRHWLKFHILNYIAFFFMAVHSWGVGTDIRTPPFVWVFWAAVSLVSLTVVYKFLAAYKQKFLLSNERPD